MSFHGGLAGAAIGISLFARRYRVPVLSVFDIGCAVVPIGLLLGRIANFIKPELWGRPSDVPWAMVFPDAGPLPRHPSQLYEAGLEGLALFIILAIAIRFGALKRPGLVSGLFGIGYGVARIIAEFFREPDPQLGFLFGGATMGMLLVAAADRARRCDPRRFAAATADRGMTELLRELREIISSEGPISLERYIAWRSRIRNSATTRHASPSAPRGDFVTAPEISQMFGELIGLWAAEVWRLSELPPPMRLVELGPGRGTLMADALRADARHPDACEDQVEVHLVETSPRLIEDPARHARGIQSCRSEWHSEIADLPDGAAIIIANEFFDALPVQHFVRTQKGWCERMVGLDAEGKLKFGLRPHPGRRPLRSLRATGLSSRSTRRHEPSFARCRRALWPRVARFSSSITAMPKRSLGRRCKRYATTASSTHWSRLERAISPPMWTLPRLAREAEQRAPGCTVRCDQAEFLLSLGIRERAEMLQSKASPAQAQSITSALAASHRLHACRPMGRLFKAMAITPARHALHSRLCELTHADCILPQRRQSRKARARATPSSRERAGFRPASMPA